MSVLINWTRYSISPWTGNFCLLIIICSLLSGPVTAAAAVSVSRKVLVLYDSESGQTQRENIFFENAQVVLDYYGILCDYKDIAQGPLPDSTTMQAYRGVITWFTTNKMPNAKTYLSWLSRQMESGRKVVILDQLGGTLNQDRDPALKKLVENIYRRLGVKYEADFTTSSRLVRYVYKDRQGVEFERRYPPVAPHYRQFTPLNRSVKTYLSLMRTDKKDSESAVIITSPSGGFAEYGYILWAEAVKPYRKKWYLNPFLFFEEALELKALPKPDPTTLNGLRVAFSHIDGDAFPGPSRIDAEVTCSRIITDHILKKYDFPVTVSVVVGEIDPQAAGDIDRVRLAREIFSLDNVEPASHSYSHPFYWDPEYKGQEYHQHHGIPVPDYVFDSRMEIDYSMQYISRELSPPDKPCQVFLWSGNCVPLESDIARCDALGYLNMNGGDTVFDDYFDSYTNVAPLYQQEGKRYQVHCGQANENILTNLWTAPHHGYRGMIETMKRTELPKRLKPIDVYYHFYSGEYSASLKALKDVYDWVVAQDVAPIFTSQYLRMVQGYFKTKLKQVKPGHYLIEDYGDCLTVRFDMADVVPDLFHCRNVLGYSREPRGLYVSLAPQKGQAVVVLARGAVAVPRPFLQKASGQVMDFDFKEKGGQLKYQGFGRGSITIGGLKPNNSYAVSGTALSGGNIQVSSDGDGALCIRGLTTGTLNLNVEVKIASEG